MQLVASNYGTAQPSLLLFMKLHSLHCF